MHAIPTSLACILAGLIWPHISCCVSADGDHPSSDSTYDVFRRYDRSDYLSRRERSPLDNGAIRNKLHMHSQPITKTASMDKYNNVEDEIDQTHKTSSSGRRRIPDDPRGCTLYGAQSSIPNSGLGMYTTLAHSQYETIGLPEIGFPFIDPDRLGTTLFSNYPWGDRYLGASHLEAEESVSVIPALGMLVNSHMGMKSTQIDLGKGCSLIKTAMGGGQSKAYLDTVGWEADEPGRGGSSQYFNVQFEVINKSLERLDISKTSARAQHATNHGTEIFVDYGVGYFEKRKETTFSGTLIPFAHHFKRADKLIWTFLQQNHYLSLRHASQEEIEKMGGPENIPLLLQVALEGNDTQLANLNSEELKELYESRYQSFLQKAREEDPKIAIVLPPTTDKINDLKKVDLSTARYSVPTSLQPTSWLQTHGFCMDNMRMGRSTTAQAGNGAFAVRFMEKESVVASTPVIPMHKDVFTTKMKGNGIQSQTNSKQMLINYCFGHTNSTLLLFPYTSTVHSINHRETMPSNSNGEHINHNPKKTNFANVKLSWSHSEYHQSDLLNMTIQSIHDLQKTGLMIDIIATRDILVGEEIFLDYGKEWARNWDEHVANWESCNRRNNESNDDGYTSTLPSPTIIKELNDEKNTLLRTSDEQMLNPYPSHVQTICYFNLPSYVLYGIHYKTWEFTTKPETYPCTIMSRSSFHDTGNALKPLNSIDDQRIDQHLVHLYTVNVTIDNRTQYITRHVPRYGIMFAEKAYKSNQHMRCGFRSFIGLPDEMMPAHWIDQL